MQPTLSEEEEIAAKSHKKRKKDTTGERRGYSQEGRKGHKD